jgi:hypothetical protein
VFVLTLDTIRAVTFGAALGDALALSVPADRRAADIEFLDEASEVGRATQHAAIIADAVAAGSSPNHVRHLVASGLAGWALLQPTRYGSRSLQFAPMARRLALDLESMGDLKFPPETGAASHVGAVSPLWPLVCGLAFARVSIAELAADVVGLTHPSPDTVGAAVVWVQFLAGLCRYPDMDATEHASRSLAIRPDLGGDVGSMGETYRFALAQLIESGPGCRIGLEIEALVGFSDPTEQVAVAMAVVAHAEEFDLPWFDTVSAAVSCRRSCPDLGTLIGSALALRRPDQVLDRDLLNIEQACRLEGVAASLYTRQQLELRSMF